MLTFLKKHYEKAIFIAFLLVFVIALVWQLQIIMAAFINPHTLVIKDQGANYTPVNMDQYNVVQQLADSGKWSGSKARNEKDRDFTDLTNPIRAARCPHCSKIIPETNFSIDHKCSMCGRVLKDLKWKEDTTLDTDEDGIPDKVELEVGMNDRDKNDIYQDLDGDGYSNIYEYKTSKTKVNDAKSRPALIHRIVLTRIRRIKLPITIKSVKTNGSDDKSTWLIQGEELKKRRTKFWALGDEVKLGNDKYKITGVEYKTEKQFDRSLKTHKDVDVSTVSFEVIKNNKTVGEPIVAVVDQTVYEPKEKIDLKDVISDRRYKSLEEGEVFDVGTQKTGVEKYLITEVSTEKRTIKVKENVKNGKTYTVGVNTFLDEQIEKRNSLRDGAGNFGKQPGSGMKQQPEEELFNFNKKTK